MSTFITISRLLMATLPRSLVMSASRSNIKSTNNRICHNKQYVKPLKKREMWGEASLSITNVTTLVNRTNTVVAPSEEKMFAPQINASRRTVLYASHQKYLEPFEKEYA